MLIDFNFEAFHRIVFLITLRGVCRTYLARRPEFNICETVKYA